MVSVRKSVGEGPIIHDSATVGSCSDDGEGTPPANRGVGTCSNQTDGEQTAIRRADLSGFCLVPRMSRTVEQEGGWLVREEADAHTPSVLGWEPGGRSIDWLGVPLPTTAAQAIMPATGPVCECSGAPGFAAGQRRTPGHGEIRRRSHP